MHPTHLPLLFAAAVLLTAGCRDRDDQSARGSSTGGGGVTMRIGGEADGRALQRGDIRIVSVEGGVDLALLGDTISGGLSQYTLAKVKRETDTAAVQAYLAGRNTLLTAPTASAGTSGFAGGGACAAPIIP